MFMRVDDERNNRLPRHIMEFHSSIKNSLLLFRERTHFTYQPNTSFKRFSFIKVLENDINEWKREKKFNRFQTHKKLFEKISPTHEMILQKNPSKAYTAIICRKQDIFSSFMRRLAKTGEGWNEKSTCFLWIFLNGA